MAMMMESNQENDDMIEDDEQESMDGSEGPLHKKAKVEEEPTMDLATVKALVEARRVRVVPTDEPLLEGGEKQLDKDGKTVMVMHDRVNDVHTAVAQFANPLDTGYYQFSTEFKKLSDESLKYMARCLTCDKAYAVKMTSSAGRSGPFDGLVAHYKTDSHARGAASTATLATTSGTLLQSIIESRVSASPGMYKSMPFGNRFVPTSSSTHAASSSSSSSSSSSLPVGVTAVGIEQLRVSGSTPAKAAVQMAALSPAESLEAEYPNQFTTNEERGTYCCTTCFFSSAGLSNGALLVNAQQHLESLAHTSAAQMMKGQKMLHQCGIISDRSIPTAAESLRPVPTQFCEGLWMPYHDYGNGNVALRGLLGLPRGKTWYPNQHAPIDIHGGRPVEESTVTFNGGRYKVEHLGLGIEQVHRRAVFGAGGVASSGHSRPGQSAAA